MSTQNKFLILSLVFIAIVLAIDMFFSVTNAPMIIGRLMIRSVAFFLGYFFMVRFLLHSLRDQ